MRFSDLSTQLSRRLGQGLILSCIAASAASIAYAQVSKASTNQLFRVPVIDTNAAAILRGVEAKLARLGTYEADIRVWENSPTIDTLKVTTDYQIQLSRTPQPRFRIQRVSFVDPWMPQNVSRISAWDGTTFWRASHCAAVACQNLTVERYWHKTHGRSVLNLRDGIPAWIPLPAPTHAFFSGSAMRTSNPGAWTGVRLGDIDLRSLRVVGTETWNGSVHQVIEWTHGNGFQLPGQDVLLTERLYVSSDSMLTRVVTHATVDGKFNLRKTTDIRVTNIRCDHEIPDSIFAAAPRAKQVYYNEWPDPLWPGMEAPDFRATTADGKQFHLAEALKHHKAVYLKFWGIECGPCRKDFPASERLYRELKDRGVLVVTVAMNTPLEVVQEYVRHNKITIPFVMDTWLPQEGPPSTPRRSYLKTLYNGGPAGTYVVIGQDQKIAYYSWIADATAIRGALARLGI